MEIVSFQGAAVLLGIAKRISVFGIALAMSGHVFALSCRIFINNFLSFVRLHEIYWNTLEYTYMQYIH